jgi:hypothetical protein
MYCADDILDASHAAFKTSVNRLWICSGDPQTYAEASAAMLGEKSIDQYSFSASQDGDTDGRKIIMSEQSNVPITAQGLGSHICFVDTTTSRLRYSISRTFDKELTVGSTVTIPATNILPLRDQTLVG